MINALKMEEYQRPRNEGSFTFDELIDHGDIDVVKSSRLVIRSMQELKSAVGILKADVQSLKHCSKSGHGLCKTDKLSPETALKSRIATQHKLSNELITKFDSNLNLMKERCFPYLFERFCQRYRISEFKSSASYKLPKKVQECRDKRDSVVLVGKNKQAVDGIGPDTLKTVAGGQVTVIPSESRQKVVEHGSCEEVNKVLSKCRKPSHALKLLEETGNATTQETASKIEILKRRLLLAQRQLKADLKHTRKFTPDTVGDLAHDREKEIVSCRKQITDLVTSLRSSIALTNQDLFQQLNQQFGIVVEGHGAVSLEFEECFDIGEMEKEVAIIKGMGDTLFPQLLSLFNPKPSKEKLNPQKSCSSTATSTQTKNQNSKQPDETKLIPGFPDPKPVTTRSKSLSNKEPVEADLDARILQPNLPDASTDALNIVQSVNLASEQETFGTESATNKSDSKQCDGATEAKHDSKSITPVTIFDVLLNLNDFVADDKAREVERLKEKILSAKERLKVDLIKEGASGHQKELVLARKDEIASHRAELVSIVVSLRSRLVRLSPGLFSRFTQYFGLVVHGNSVCLDFEQSIDAEIQREFRNKDTETLYVTSCTTALEDNTRTAQTGQAGTAQTGQAGKAQTGQAGTAQTGHSTTAQTGHATTAQTGHAAEFQAASAASMAESNSVPIKPLRLTLFDVLLNLNDFVAHDKAREVERLKAKILSAKKRLKVDLIEEGASGRQLELMRARKDEIASHRTELASIVMSLRYRLVQLRQGLFRRFIQYFNIEVRNNVVYLEFEQSIDAEIQRVFRNKNTKTLYVTSCAAPIKENSKKTQKVQAASAATVAEAAIAATVAEAASAATVVELNSMPIKAPDIFDELQTNGDVATLRLARSIEVLKEWFILAKRKLALRSSKSAMQHAEKEIGKNRGKICNEVVAISIRLSPRVMKLFVKHFGISVHGNDVLFHFEKNIDWEIESELLDNSIPVLPYCVTGTNEIRKKENSKTKKFDIFDELETRRDVVALSEVRKIVRLKQELIWAKERLGVFLTNEETIAPLQDEIIVKSRKKKKKKKKEKNIDWYRKEIDFHRKEIVNSVRFLRSRVLSLLPNQFNLLMKPLNIMLHGDTVCLEFEKEVSLKIERKFENDSSEGAIGINHVVKPSSVSNLEYEKATKAELKSLRTEDVVNMGALTYTADPEPPSGTALNYLYNFNQIASKFNLSNCGYFETHLPSDQTKALRSESMMTSPHPSQSEIHEGGRQMNMAAQSGEQPRQIQVGQYEDGIRHSTKHENPVGKPKAHMHNQRSKCSETERKTLDQLNLKRQMHLNSADDYNSSVNPPTAAESGTTRDYSNSKHYLLAKHSLINDSFVNPQFPKRQSSDDSLVSDRPETHKRRKGEHADYDPSLWPERRADYVSYPQQIGHRTGDHPTSTQYQLQENWPDDYSKPQKEVQTECNSSNHKFQERKSRMDNFFDWLLFKRHPSDSRSLQQQKNRADNSSDPLQLKRITGDHYFHPYRQKRPYDKSEDYLDPVRSEHRSGDYLDKIGGYSDPLRSGPRSGDQYDPYESNWQENSTDNFPEHLRTERSTHDYPEKYWSQQRNSTTCGISDSLLSERELGDYSDRYRQQRRNNASDDFSDPLRSQLRIGDTQQPHYFAHSAENPFHSIGNYSKRTTNYQIDW